MFISRQSPISGRYNVRYLDISAEQWAEWNSPNRRNVQDIFPNLSAGDREFLLTGITPEEWDKMFPAE